MKNSITRRNFLAKVGVGGVGALFLSRRAFGAGEPAATGLFVVHGTDLPRMLTAGIGKLGGWAAFVKRGSRVVVKVNSAWASTPEEGGNTNPLLVESCVKDCLAAGAESVVVPENPCSPAREAFTRSGIEAAVQRAGGKMYCPEAKHYRKTAIPRGVSLKEAAIVAEVLDCGCLINLPVAKHHAGAQLTLSMKNWMGSVADRGFWHRSNLHQCIADLSTLIKPNLIVLDATRILLTNGPRGPGKLAYPKQIVLGTDPVAVDAYAATLFDKKPFDIQHIKLAHEMKVGCGDLAQITLTHIDA
jgi:uncharacterized protein (DUF362 family)